MAIEKILDTDKLNTGWRTKYNATVDEIFTAITDLGTGILRFTKFSGATVDIDIKAGVNASLNDKAGKITVTSAGTPVVFPTAYPGGTDYLILRNCQNADGDVGYKITSRTVTGFTVTSDTDDAVFEYKCIKL